MELTTGGRWLWQYQYPALSAAKTELIEQGFGCWLGRNCGSWIHGGIIEWKKVLNKTSFFGTLGYRAVCPAGTPAHLWKEHIKSSSQGKRSSINFKTCICSFLCRGLSIYKLWHRSGCSQLHLPHGFGVQSSWVLRKMHTSSQMFIHQLREITKWERHACLWVQLCTGWKICIAGFDQERFRSVWIGYWIVTKFRGVKLSHCRTCGETEGSKCATGQTQQALLKSADPWPPRHTCDTYDVSYFDADFINNDGVIMVYWLFIDPSHFTYMKAHILVLYCMFIDCTCKNVKLYLLRYTLSP